MILTIKKFLIVFVFFSIIHFIVSNIDESMYSKKLDLVDSMYFSMVTQTTVGYGDITPKKRISKILVTIQILLLIWIVYSIKSDSS